jgi:hypothetical protein
VRTPPWSNMESPASGDSHRLRVTASRRDLAERRAFDQRTAKRRAIGIDLGPGKQMRRASSSRLSRHDIGGILFRGSELRAPSTCEHGTPGYPPIAAAAEAYGASSADHCCPTGQSNFRRYKRRRTLSACKIFACAISARAISARDARRHVGQSSSLLGRGNKRDKKSGRAGGRYKWFEHELHSAQRSRLAA